MQAKHHVILYTFLSVALLIAVFVGVGYGLRADNATQVLEDSYTQRILETQEHLQAMSIKLNKIPVAGEGDALFRLLSEISRQADGVVAGLTALPLSHVAMSDTTKFCNQLSEYSMELALLAAGGAQPTPEQLTQLKALQSQCTLLGGQLATAREAMVSQSLRLATDENVYYMAADLAARPLEQVADKDNGMDYPTMIYDGAFSDARHFGTPKALGNQMIDAAQAVEIAVRFVGSGRVKEAVQGVKTEGQLEAYGVNLTLNDGTMLTAEVTKQGGKLLWMVPEQANFGQSLTLEECTQNGSRFLRENGYGEMQANHYQVYDGLAVINFVAVQDGVLLYPDLVKLQLRMDTGEVVGLEANNYLMNHVARKELTPVLSKAQALSQVTPLLTAEDATLCLIPYRDTERLCYEISGTYEENQYRVYLDAATGEEVEVLMILQTSEGMLSA